jgi:Fe-S-cluster containining protein
MPHSRMRRARAKVALSAGRDVRRAALACSPSINSMHFGCGEVWQNLRRGTPSGQRLSRDFPGDPATGLLGKTKDQRRRFEDFANEEPCPALDPHDGTCDLYDSRPMTCRTFGPPVRVEGGGLGVCELCYHGFSEQEIAACEMIPDPEDLESRLLKEAAKGMGRRGDTIIAFPLAA